MYVYIHMSICIDICMNIYIYIYEYTKYWKGDTKQAMQISVIAMKKKHQYGVHT